MQINWDNVVYVNNAGTNQPYIGKVQERRYRTEDTQHIRESSARRGIWWGHVTVFEDATMRITIADRNDTNATPQESAAWGAFKTIHIDCKITGALIVVEDAELADKFFAKFQRFLEQNDLTMNDFTEYGRNQLLCDLFEEFLEKMGARMSYYPTSDFDPSRKITVNDLLTGSTARELRPANSLSPLPSSTRLNSRSIPTVQA